MVAQSKVARAKPETTATLGKIEKNDRTPEVGCWNNAYDPYLQSATLSFGLVDQSTTSTNYY